MKKVLMIAGPNGSGKTTTALELISNQAMLYEFLNADEIAKGLAPLHPESMSLTASKLMVKRLKELLDTNKSFLFETTAAGTNYIKYLKNARARGYETHAIFLWLSHPEQAVKRVCERVKQGGHRIPEQVIIRRYYLGIKNFCSSYLPLVDTALIVDNSLESPSSPLIARKNKDHNLEILNTEIWEQIQETIGAQRIS